MCRLCGRQSVDPNAELGRQDLKSKPTPKNSFNAEISSKNTKTRADWSQKFNNGETKGKTQKLEAHCMREDMAKN